MTIPPYLKDYADAITTTRVEMNRERYKGTDKERRGVKESVLLGKVSREYYTEYIGILAELIIRHHCDVNPSFTTYEASTFIKEGHFVTDDCDLKVVKMINGVATNQSLSIKACEHSLKVNAKSANKDFDSDLVIFVLFTSPTDYTLKSFTPGEVRSWELKEGFSPYYELKL